MPRTRFVIDALLTVAVPDGEWKIEVQMPENRHGHIETMSEQLAEGEKLKVEFFVTSDPSIKLYGTVREIAAAAEVQGEQGNMVTIDVDIDANELRQKIGEFRQGNTVTARIYCGRRSIGYVWFHDVMDFVHKKILFRL